MRKIYIQTNGLRWGRLAVLWALAALLPSAALGEPSSGDALLLEILLENGLITEEQKAAVMREYERRSEARAEKATAVSSAPSASERTGSGNVAAAASGAESSGPPAGETAAAPRPASAPGRELAVLAQRSARLQVMGRLHPQYDFLSSSLSGSAAADPPANNRAHLRRAFIGAKARLSEQWSAQYLTDLSDAKVVTQIARAVWEPSDAHQFRFGLEKAPFGLEETTSSALVKPIERSAATRFWSEEVGLGSYHAGVYYAGKWSGGWRGVAGLTNNEKGEADRSGELGNQLSAFLRLQRSGSVFGDDRLLFGADFAHQPRGNGPGRDVSGFGAHATWDFGRATLLAEALGGSVAMPGEDAFALGWTVQASSFLADKLEGVARFSDLDTDGFGVSLPLAIRRAPSSGYRYDEVSSAYLGLNLYLLGNDAKASIGYEWSQGTEALNPRPGDGKVRETVQGFRMRMQLLY